jgi:hypothetical protein
MATAVLPPAIVPRDARARLAHVRKSVTSFHPTVLVVERTGTCALEVGLAIAALHTDIAVLRADIVPRDVRGRLGRARKSVTNFHPTALVVERTGTCALEVGLAIAAQHTDTAVLRALTVVRVARVSLGLVKSWDGRGGEDRGWEGRRRRRVDLLYSSLSLYLYILISFKLTSSLNFFFYHEAPVCLFALAPPLCLYRLDAILKLCCSGVALFQRRAKRRHLFSRGVLCSFLNKTSRVLCLSMLRKSLL